MPILRGKVDGDVLVFPREDNEFLYTQCADKLQPGKELNFSAGRSTINIIVDGEPDLTNAFRGLHDTMMYVRHDSLLVLKDGLRFDGSKLADGPVEANSAAETGPINQATSSTSVEPGKTHVPTKGPPGKLPPIPKQQTADAASAADAAWKHRHNRR